MRTAQSNSGNESITIDIPEWLVERGGHNGTDHAVARESTYGRLLARLCLLGELETPKVYTRRVKWLITFVVAVAGAAGPMGSARFFPKPSWTTISLYPFAARLNEPLAALSQITHDLHTSVITANLCISVYMLSIAFSHFSDQYSVKNLVDARYFDLCSFLFAECTWSPRQFDIFLIAMRLLSGGASSSVQTISAETIADLHGTKGA